MKYLRLIIFSILTLVIASPWIIGFVDMYHWFFFDTTLSGASYMADRFLAMVISGFLSIPMVVILLMHHEIEQERKIREKILKHREGEKDEPGTTR